MFAPPCSSFSPARDRTSVIRTKQQPWGIDAHRTLLRSQLATNVSVLLLMLSVPLISKGLPGSLRIRMQASVGTYRSSLHWQANHMSKPLLLIFVSSGHSGESAHVFFVATWTALTCIVCNIHAQTAAFAVKRASNIFSSLEATSKGYRGHALPNPIHRSSAEL